MSARVSGKLLLRTIQEAQADKENGWNSWMDYDEGVVMLDTLRDLHDLYTVIREIQTSVNDPDRMQIAIVKLIALLPESEPELVV